MDWDKAVRQTKAGARWAWQESGEGITTFGFITIMAVLAWMMSPPQDGAHNALDDWTIPFVAEPELYPDPPPLDEDGEVELDLDELKDADRTPVAPVAETDAAATTEPAVESTVALVPPVPLPEPWERYTIKRNDTLGAILRRITTDKDAISYLVTQKLNSYRKLRRGRALEYRIDAAGRLTALRYKASPDLYLEFTQDAAGNMLASEGAPELTSTIETRAARITERLNSLFAASDAAGLPDPIIQSLIDALETRIDFVRDTRVDDSFAVVYERLHDADGEEVAAGRLLALRFINRDKVVTGLFNEEIGGFYEPHGESLQKAFLRSPLKFSRISSRYSLRRFHPILKKWRAHRGVDFAAPRGTPVRASGDGVIEFVGTKGGYGKVIMIRHYDKYLTVYGHLHRFSSGIRKGVRVTQGQQIAQVGSTGMSTGPHLHYEFRVDGVHKDPLSTAVPTRKPDLTAEQLASFQQATRGHLEMIDGELPAAGGAVATGG